tara:strand:+ start:44 stop:319 length:276 start_codon:yes stop_codon:yes gene_type:complete
MNKFLNAGLHYFPVSSIIAINVDSSTADDCVVTVAGIQGTASSDTLTITGTETDEGAAMAEALIEEINFGKQLVIKLADFHAAAVSAAHAD